MVQAWLIMKRNHPSMFHKRYLDKEKAKQEMERLEALRHARNKQIEQSPSKGHGAVFANMKDNEPWSYTERNFTE